MKVLTSAVVAVCLTACSGASSNLKVDPDAPRIGAMGSEDLLVGERQVVGRTSSLSVGEDELRGRYRSIPVDLSWNAQYLKGTVAGQHTRLELAEGDDVRLQGSFAGMPMDLVIEKGGLSGRVGECHYALFRVKGGFRGPATCGGARQDDSVLVFPDALAQKPLGEQAALLALMLSPHMARRYVGTQRPMSWTITDPQSNHPKAQRPVSATYPRTNTPQ